MSGIAIAGLVGFIVLAILSVTSFSLGTIESVKLIKDRREDVPHKEYLKKILIYCGCFTFAFTFMLLSIYVWNSITPKWYEGLKCAFGGLIFAGSISFGTCFFITYYYGKNIPEKINKKLFIGLMVSVAVCFLAFLATTDAFADYGGDNFLLPKGINFSKGFVRPDSYDSANIAFYALCILGGAVFVYFLCDHFYYKEYGKHGMLESTFLLAFPAGIIGARIAYVIGNWDIEFKGREFWHVFAIWEGGLTILGGAIAGIVVGVLWHRHVNKKVPILRGIDLIVPTILIAQAIGRWGNFFNCEVHGIQVEAQYWEWLPRIVFNNARYSSVNGWADPGKIYVPLFLIEAMSNMLGYFLLAHLFGIKLKKYTKDGDLAFGYIAWYGLTRTIMEPLRDKGFNMGSNGYWSWFWSIIFIVVGILLIVINHIVRDVLDKKKNTFVSNAKADFIGASIVFAIGLALIIVGAIMMSQCPFAQKLEFNQFNIGVILLTIGGSFFFGSFIPISKVIISYANA